MCYARRQRSSWARIKLSKKLYINQCLHWMLSTHQSDLFAQLLVRASVDLFLSPLNSKEFSESLVLCLLSLYTWLLFNFQWALWFACCLSAAYLLYHIRLPLSRGFSNFFQVFFAVPFGFAFPLVGSLYIISQPLPFVKGFFKLFSSFFAVPFRFRSLSCGQPA